jgi:hypothetical protein
MLSKEIQLEVNKGAMLPLMEEFYTIQGEVFTLELLLILLESEGCDVGCIGVTKVGMHCIHLQASIKLLIMQKKYAETVVVQVSQCGYDLIDTNTKR